MENKSIFIVDDEPSFCEMIQEVLEDDFDTYTAATGSEALENISELTPNIVLLDVGLPDIDGYQVCQKIKESDHDDQISVVFISGRESIEERLKGYDSGADDYLVKPINIEELRVKMHAISKFQRGKESLKTQEKFSRDMAFQAMSEASQYGSALQFFKQASQCTSNMEIAQAVVDLGTSFSLKCSVQIRRQNTITLRSGGGNCSPIEEQLFEVLCSRGRVYNFNQRYMFNDAHVSILVTDMPIGDEVLSGRLNDLMATIVEAAESAIINLARFDGLKDLLGATQATVTTVANSYSEHKGKTISLMDSMISQMEYALGGLGLTEEQEEFFIKLAESTLESLIELHGEAFIIEQNLEAIVNKIKDQVEGA